MLPIGRNLGLLGFVLAASAVGPACTYSSRAALVPELAPTDPQQVMLFARPDPGREYEIVGLVAAQTDGERADRVLAELRRRAAELGANAVVGVEIEYDMGAWSAGLDASGTAVRFR